MRVFPVIGGVPAVRPSALVVATLDGLTPLASTPVEQDVDAALVEEAETGPEKELWFMTGDDQEKSDVAGFVTIASRPRGRAPRAEELEHMRPADPALIE